MYECRWGPGLLYDLIGIEGATHLAGEVTTSCSLHMGSPNVWHVQLSAQRVQNQECRLSVLAAAILRKLY